MASLTSVEKWLGVMNILRPLNVISATDLGMKLLTATFTPLVEFAQAYTTIRDVAIESGQDVQIVLFLTSTKVPISTVVAWRRMTDAT